MSQKRKIKSDYLKKKQSESSQLDMSTTDVKFSVGSIKTSMSQGANNQSRLNTSCDSGLASWKTSAVTDKTSKQSFFPKSKIKTKTILTLNRKNY